MISNWKLEIVQIRKTIRNKEIFAQIYTPKKKGFLNLNIKALNDNKKFWNKTNNIILKEKN